MNRTNQSTRSHQPKHSFSAFAPHSRRLDNPPIEPMPVRDIKHKLDLKRFYSPGHGFGQLVVSRTDLGYDVLAAFLPCAVIRIKNSTRFYEFETQSTGFHYNDNDNIQIMEINVDMIVGPMFRFSDGTNVSIWLPYAGIKDKMRFAFRALAAIIHEFVTVTLRKVVDRTTSYEAAPVFIPNETTSKVIAKSAPVAPPALPKPDWVWPLPPPRFVTQPTLESRFINKGPAKPRKYNRVVSSLRELYELVGRVQQQRSNTLKQHSRFHIKPLSGSMTLRHAY